MKQITLIILLSLGMYSIAIAQDRMIARQGQVSFFSYTTVENISAQNNQVLSIVDTQSGSIAVSMLMNAFIFEKALMKEHFNESYIESDIYPKATFEGTIENFDATKNGIQTRMIIGVLNLHGVANEISIKATIENDQGQWKITGDFKTLVRKYNINIPPLLARNIAESITVNFRFEYETYED